MMYGPFVMDDACCDKYTGIHMHVYVCMCMYVYTHTHTHTYTRLPTVKLHIQTSSHRVYVQTQGSKSANLTGILLEKAYLYCPTLWLAERRMHHCIVWKIAW